MCGDRGLGLWGEAGVLSSLETPVLVFPGLPQP